MASTIPVPRSYQVILSDIVDTFRARYGIRQLKVGGPILTAFEANAQSDLRATQDVFNLLDLRDINRLTGAALDFVAADEDLTRLPATPANTKIDVTDTTIQRISSKIYSGAVAPVAGSAVIKVVNAVAFPSTGTIYIGRGTTNVEGPITYSATAFFGTYWTITLSTATQRFHNLNEDVVVGQNGDRTIPTGTLFATARDGRTDPVEFTSTADAVILDGEVTVTGIAATCKVPGTVGNVIKGSISVVNSSPFPGATCTNPQPVISGLDIESDDLLRERLLLAKASRSKGTAYAILFNTSGVFSADESKRVVSTTIVTPANEPATVYIDDGTGYEELTAGVPYEVLMDSASGGEQYFSLSALRPISRAFAKTSLVAPFNLVPGCKLSVKVGGILSEHTFNTTDFTAISSALAAEVVSSINSNPNVLFSARTAESGTRVSIFARSETNEDLQVGVPSSGIDANEFLGFSSSINYTTKIYKNDKLLYKDGRNAIINSAPQSFWTTMTTGIKVAIAVDGTPLTDYTFTDADFVDADTGFATLSQGNTIASWAAVFNAKVPGITAQDGGGFLILTSNRGSQSNASIRITTPIVPGGASDLVAQGMFTAAAGLSAVGINKDYTLNRNTTQVKLFSPLAATDTLTVGSFNTRAYAQSAPHDGGTISLNNIARIWVAVDGKTSIVKTSIGGTTTFSLSTPSAGVVNYALSPTVSTLPKFGDWAVLWDPILHSQGVFRINGSGSSAFSVRRPWVTTTDAQTGVSLLDNGMVFARTASYVQEIRLPGGVQNLDTIVSAINDQLVGATCSLYRGRYLRIATNSFNGGDVMVVSADLEGQKLGFITGVLNTSAEPHLASIAAGVSEAFVPEFGQIGLVQTVSTNEKIPEITSNLTGGALLNGGRKFYGLLAYDNATYPGMTPLSDEYRELSAVSSPSSSFTLRERETGAAPTQFTVAPGALSRDSGSNVTATTPTNHGFIVGDMVTIASITSPDANFANGTFSVTSVPTATSFVYTQAGTSSVSNTQSMGINEWEGPMVGDLFVLGNPYAINWQDSLTVIMNNDPDTQTYNIPLYRKVLLSGLPSSTLAVLDEDNSDANLSDAFGTTNPTFFNDFWVFMHPRVVSHLSVSGKQIMWRLNKMGPYGNKWNIRYVYPDVDNTQAITARMENDGVTLSLVMPSDKARTGLSLFASTSFTSTVTASAGGYSIVLSYSKPATVNSGRIGSTVHLTTASAHGFNPGDIFYLSPGNASFPPGPKIATAGTTGTDIFYSEAGPAVTFPVALTSTVTSAPADVNFTSGPNAVQVNDIVHISSQNVSFVPQGSFRVTAVTSTSVTFYYPIGSAPSAMTTPQKLGVATGLNFYPIKTTLSKANSYITFAGTSLSGLLTAANYNADAGTGVISISTQEEAAQSTVNYGAVSVAVWQFQDGVNWVQTSNLSSPTSTLLFKQASTGTYTTPWANEEAHLVPATSDTIVRWLNSSAVTGIFEQAELDVINRDGRLQISALNPGELGGIEVTESNANGKVVEIIGVGDNSINKVNVSRAFDDVLMGDSWAVIQNSEYTPKTLTGVTGSNTIALSGNTVTFNTNVNVMTDITPSVSTPVIIHKVGNFAVYLFPTSGTLPNLVGKWLQTSIANASTPNSTTKRIIQSGYFSSSAFTTWFYIWVENPNATTEQVVTSGPDFIRYFTEDSVMPGDQFEIGYALGSSQNIGIFTVTGTTPNSGVFTVNNNFVMVSATAIGSNLNNLRLQEPGIRLIKKIDTVGLDPGSTFVPTDPGLSWIKFSEGNLLNRISQTLGGTVFALGRLQFDTTPTLGTNGYNITTGLIGEVAKVLYGDLNQPTVYPGVVAAGASVNISGPNIKRIQVSLQLRLRTGASASSVLDRVRNSVASAINAIPLGTPVDIARIVSAARSVAGVAAVAVLSPTFNSSSDIIPVQSNEKPFVFDAASDINLVVVS